MTTAITRQAAMDHIAGHIADRTAFIIITPPAAVADLAERLTAVISWTGYLDGGTPAVIQTQHADALAMANLLAGPSIAVVIVPKTVPAATLGHALGQSIPADGSQDLLLLHDEDGPFVWPLLFVDALAQVDPRAAAQIRATDLAHMS